MPRATAARTKTHHVFLAGNDLPRRWQTRARFTIGELGFGTGLNFLVTWRAFRDTAPATHRLHYISFEQFPFMQEMLASLYSPPRNGGARGGSSAEIGRCNPHLTSPFQGEELSRQLIDRYPLRLPGIHRVEFERVTLTLCFGDARELLPQLEGANVDAWYLDGFAPAKNPELWGEELFRALAAASAPDATVATYSAAAAVREHLCAAGFTVEKRKGFGRKKDMVVGRRRLSPCSADGSREPESHHMCVVGRTGGSGSGGGTPPGATRLIVVGGGIAGCTAARALAERGHHVTLLEKHRIAAGASGNEAAVLYPPITKHWIARTEWYFTGYGFTLRQLARWREMGAGFRHRLARHDQAADGCGRYGTARRR